MPSMERYDPFSPNFGPSLLNSSPDYEARNHTYTGHPIGESGIMTPQLTFRERDKRLRALDDEKNQLIDDLLYQLETTQHQIQRLQLDHAREVQYNRDGQQREAALRDQLVEVKTIVDRNPYVTALIDGDGTVFKQEFLANGEKGGQDAAAAIVHAVNESIKPRWLCENPPQVVVRIYANVKSLAENLYRANVIDRTAVLDDFIRGFNGALELSEIVDTGPEAQSTQKKICAQFRLNLYNCHCHQIFLGCAGDDDYASLLQETSRDRTVTDHVTLLEAVPLGDQVVTVKDNFKVARFDNVFRSTKLTTALPLRPLPAIVATLPALTRVESNGTVGTASGSSTPAMTWATMTAQSSISSGATSRTSTTRTSTPLSITSPEFQPAKPVVRMIERNRYGHRIDRVDASIPSHELQRIKKLKLCNIYYLQGPDFCTSANCSHSHTYPLSKGERCVLREVARMTPCYYKGDCADLDCIYGHRCSQNQPHEPGCWFGKDCRFYGWGHGIDTTVVKTTRV